MNHWLEYDSPLRFKLIHFRIWYDTLCHLIIYFGLFVARFIVARQKICDSTHCLQQIVSNPCIDLQTNEIWSFQFTQRIISWINLVLAFNLVLTIVKSTVNILIFTQKLTEGKTSCVLSNFKLKSSGVIVTKSIIWRGNTPGFVFSQACVIQCV